MNISLCLYITLFYLQITVPNSRIVIFALQILNKNNSYRVLSVFIDLTILFEVGMVALYTIS